MKLAKVSLNIEYVVDAEDEKMLNKAINTLASDILNISNNQEDISNWITVTPDDKLTADQIPDFLQDW